MFSFFKKAFRDIKESAKAQHEVDKANFAAAKAESKAQFAEAKAVSRSKTRKTIERDKQDAQIARANQRTAEAQARIAAAKGKN